MKPTQQNAYFLTDENGDLKALVKDKKIYEVTLLNDDGIARLFNGGDYLPIVPGELSKSK